MQQKSTVSRRSLVTLVAGAWAATAGTIAQAGPLTGSSAALTDSRELLAAGQRRVLTELGNVRRAIGGRQRARAFAAFTAALREHDRERSAQAADVGSTRELTALYRQPEPEHVLAAVIARELESQAADGPAWMTRFDELEALVRTRFACSTAVVA